MATFAMSSFTAREKNIKHMLSSEHPVKIQFREYDGNQDLNIQKRYHEQQIKPPERFEEKFMELFVGRNIGLPKAPAFWRPKSRTQLKKIISRVSTPTHNIPTNKIDEEDRTLCPKDRLKAEEIKRAKSASSLKRTRPLSSKELNSSCRRMTTQNKIGRLRYSLRSGQTEYYEAVTAVKTVYGDFTKI
ncbi:Hypothetical predicted protein [Mytilus galloprovincialis]|uniref:Uncharacterized protein n=1 Tax=Mytilus galloprovincialis TaxID=29158 RepID=A0A8B6GYQ5_MYTGA|nr:Hypothetical predicted protein [Mytilus galloprovincialis]